MSCIGWKRDDVETSIFSLFDNFKSRMTIMSMKYEGVGFPKRCYHSPSQIQ